MNKIKIVDFPFCNTSAISRYASKRNISISCLEQNDTPHNSDLLILPGVGKFGQAMQYLEDNFLTSLVKEYAEKASILGICLGMQILLEASEESPTVKGLGLIKGNCRKLTANSNFRVPHVGWNSLVINKYVESPVNHIHDKKTNPDYYFVHSYYCDIEEPDNVSSYFSHSPSVLLPASCQSHNVYGFQFHPEKSGKPGYTLLDQVFQRK